MSFLKFNQVFFGLMAVSFLTAFILPPRFTEPTKGQLESIFYPVSRPSRRIAAWAFNRFLRDEPVDARADATIRQENDQLKQEVTQLAYQLDELKIVNADRETLGELRRLCTPFAVVGDDSGNRDTLILKGSSLSGLKESMPVLYRGGLAGWIDNVGLGGARVRLLTDAGFRVTGNFVRFQPDATGRLIPYKIRCDDPLVEGLGGGRMVIRNLTKQKVYDAKIQVGDWVVLDDTDWDIEVKGTRIGRVMAAPGDRPGGIGFAEIRLEPMTGLNRLMEVMVLTRGRQTGARPEPKG